MAVFCFDFDGVIADSAPETALAAWRAARVFWKDHSGDLPAEIRQRFCRLRPVMHTGFEAIPLLRLIWAGERSEEDLFSEFPKYRDALIAAEGLEHNRLQEVFGAARDELIANDEQAWLEANAFYPGLREVLATSLQRHTTYVITTKQERFVRRLFKHAGLTLPDEQLFGLEQQLPKPAILQRLLSKPALVGGRFHFIEDRYETLLDVLSQPALAAVWLYLADWGYNTPAQRAAAMEEPRIQVVNRTTFARLVAES